MSDHPIVDPLSSSSLLNNSNLGKLGGQRPVVKMNRVMAALHNRETVVYLICTRGPLSQLQIAQLTQLRTSTVSDIVRELQTRGLIQEGSPLSTQRVGRKQTLIQMKPDAAWSMGLNLDTMGNKLCLINAAGHILCQHSFAAQPDVNAFLDAIPLHVAQLVQQYRLAADRAAGVTVSVPGVVDPAAGRVVRSMSLQLEDYPLAELMGPRLNLNVAIERNVVCGAYAERYVGCASKSDHFLYFLARPSMHRTLGRRQYSFGLAMVLNGGTYRGHNWAAGELHPDQLLPYANQQAFFAPEQTADPTALATALGLLGKGLAGALDLLDPGMLVICSDEQLLAHDNLEILTKAIHESLISIPARELEVVRSPLGIDGPVYGAALLGLHRALKQRLESLLPHSG